MDFELGRTSGWLLGATFALLAAADLAMAPIALAQTPPPAADVKKPLTVKIDGEDLFAVGFDKLASFEYTVVDAGTGASAAEIEAAKKREQVPPWVRLYDGKRIALTGFLMPLKVENGLTTKLIIMRDITTCCYGNVPNMNEYVIVTMKGEGVKPIQDVPVVMTGVFRITEKYENGYLSSIFQMEGEKFLGPKK
jgi:hypothetical protein